MATTVLFESLTEALAEAGHDWSADTITVALSNTLPDAAADALIGDITEIAYTNLSSRTVTVASSTHTGAVYTLSMNQLDITCSGGASATFQYIILYNSTTGALICYSDYGAPITMADTNVLRITMPDITITIV